MRMKSRADRFSNPLHESSGQLGHIRILMLGPALHLSGGVTSVQNLLLLHPPPGCTLSHIATVSHGTTAQKLIAFIRALIRLVRRVTARNTDIVHIHLSQRGSAFRKGLCLCIAHLGGVPVVVHAHGSEFRPFYSSMPRGGRWALATVYRRADLLIVLSESWRSYYRDALGIPSERIRVMLNPVRLPASRPEPTNQRSVRIVFLGRLGQRKGVYDLVRAFAGIPATERHRAELVVAGDGDIAGVKGLASTLGVTDEIDVRNWMSSGDAQALLLRSDIFVLPSYNEGLPMALLEAMVCGLAVVTTPVGGIPEVVRHGENGILVDPGDVAGLTGALSTLLTAPTYRRGLGSAAKHTAERLDVRLYSDELGGLYRDLHRRSQRGYHA